VQLTELLFQKVRELGAQGAVALRPGYVGVVSKSRTLRPLLCAALFPGPEDARLLSDGSAPARVGVGLLAADGGAYRLLREIGGARQLHRFDVAARRFAPLTEDDLEIGSFLRGETQLPAPEAYERFFVVGAQDLPSRRVQVSQDAQGPIDAERAKALKAELELTRRYEEAQDRLFKVSQRLHELVTTANSLAATEEEVRQLDELAARSPFSPEKVKDLTERAKRADADQRRHADELGELMGEKRRLQANKPGAPEPLWRDPLFLGGLALGAAIDAVAFLMRKPSIAFVALLPYIAPVVAALQWIGAKEDEKLFDHGLVRLKEREEQAKRAFAQEQAPLQAALRAAQAESPMELLDLFKSRAETLQKLQAARAKLEKQRAEPLAQAAASERDALSAEKQGLEAAVAAQGFARPLAEIEKELRAALGQDPTAVRSSSPGAADVADARILSERAAELVGCGPGDLWQQIGPRFATYLAALTEQRLVAGTHDGNQLLLAAPDGRSGPYATLPQPLRDLAWIALRLVLFERVAAVKKLPIFVDDTFGTLDAPKKVLVHKMLKGIAAQTQVIHRIAEPPPQGIFDAVVPSP
jgi:uncharacterized protein YhaN